LKFFEIFWVVEPVVGSGNPQVKPLINAVLKVNLLAYIAVYKYHGKIKFY